MKHTKFIIYLIILAFVYTTGCKKEGCTDSTATNYDEKAKSDDGSCLYAQDTIPEEETKEIDLLIEYLEGTANHLGKDYVATDCPSIITAEALYTDLIGGANVYVIDIRSASTYDAGHIDGAVNVALGDLLTHLAGISAMSYDKIVITCYTGQTAGFATSLLRLVGYSNAYSLKWGMSSWHTDFAGSWNNSIGNTYSTQFTTTSTAKGTAGELPTLSTGKTSGDAILWNRVNTVLAEGFTPNSVSAATVFGNLSNYYIINYWSDADYTGIGHIPGAMQYTPKVDLNSTTYLKTLPTDKTVVVYCYTGQTSAFITAYLRVLGYTVQSLKFGANGMIYDTTTHQWTSAEIKDYAYVTTP